MFSVNSTLVGKTKAPQNMRSRHKNTKHHMILAFFNVVASRQISPHVLCGGKDMESTFYLQIINC